MTGPNVTWEQLGDWYNMLCHAWMYSQEGQRGNAEYGIDYVTTALEKLRNAQGPNASFHSLAQTEKAANNG